MNIKRSDLWRWDGTIERGPYLLLGSILLAVKINLDRLLVSLLFDRPWSVVDYLKFETIRALGQPWSSSDSKLAATLVALALPFVWAGVVLTLRRLRSAALPLWLVVLFFVPVVKFVFFAVLSIVPSRELRRSTTGRGAALGAWIPRGKAGSAATGIFVTSMLALAIGWFGANVMHEYGSSLFVGMPFCMGFLSVLIYGYHEARTLRGCVQVALLSVLLAGLVLLAAAFEGILCLLMATPLAVVLALMGGTLGWAIQMSGRWHGEAPTMIGAVVLLLPLTMSVEHFEAREPALLKVVTALDVNAPPEEVWRNVVEFSVLPPPTEWLFRIGIAYPVRAEIRGRGVGATRYCNFSTGTFVEPIEVWDEPRLLKFGVTANPAPMQEWTPYHDIRPRHLDGFLESKQGQFLLTRLQDGRTRLEGTTWYHHHMWPSGYWQFWSDAIIHVIHRRVLEHVKQLSEVAQG